MPVNDKRLKYFQDSFNFSPTTRPSSHRKLCSFLPPCSWFTQLDQWTLFKSWWKVCMHNVGTRECRWSIYCDFKRGLDKCKSIRYFRPENGIRFDGEREKGIKFNKFIDITLFLLSLCHCSLLSPLESNDWIAHSRKQGRVPI